MSKDYEVIELNREDFGDQLFEVLAKLVDILTKARYTVVIDRAEEDYIGIQFNHDLNCAYGNPTPYWITDEEYSYILSLRKNNEEK